MKLQGFVKCVVGQGRGNGWLDRTISLSREGEHKKKFSVYGKKVNFIRCLHCKSFSVIFTVCFIYLFIYFSKSGMILRSVSCLGKVTGN